MSVIGVEVKIVAVTVAVTLVTGVKLLGSMSKPMLNLINGKVELFNTIGTKSALLTGSPIATPGSQF